MPKWIEMLTYKFVLDEYTTYMTVSTKSHVIFQTTYIIPMETANPMNLQNHPGHIQCQSAKATYQCFKGQGLLSLLPGKPAVSANVLA